MCSGLYSIVCYELPDRIDFAFMLPIITRSRIQCIPESWSKINPVFSEDLKSGFFRSVLLSLIFVLSYVSVSFLRIADSHVFVSTHILSWPFYSESNQSVIKSSCAFLISVCVSPSVLIGMQ